MLLSGFASAISADNGLVSVSSDSPRVHKIVLVGDDFVVATKTPLREGEAVPLTIRGIGDYEVTSAKHVPLRGSAPAGYTATNRGSHEDPVSGIVHAICIDIKEERIAVPWNNTAATLHLTADSSYSSFGESGDKDCPNWDVEWSCETCGGISGTGRECPIPSDLPVGRHIVKAAFSENQEIYDTCIVDVISVKFSQETILGCEKCLSNLEIYISEAESHSPSGYTWSIVNDSTGGGFSLSSDGTISSVQHGGNATIKAVSKDCPDCFDSLTITICIPRDLKIKIESPKIEGTTCSRTVFFLFKPEPSSASCAEHFAFVQWVSGNVQTAPGNLCQAMSFGELIPLNNLDHMIDSPDTNPIYGSSSESPSGLYGLGPGVWASGDNPTIYDCRQGTVVNLSFETKLFCRKQIPTEGTRNMTISASPFSPTLFWAFKVRVIQNPESGLLEIGSFENNN